MIFYFSGTGNSFWVARELSKYFNDNKLIAIGDYFAKDTQLIPEFDLDSNERIGFVFPTYSWGIPPVVKQFIGKLVLNDYFPADNLIYSVITCGDECGKSYEMLHELLRKKSWECHHIYSLQMPNNYIVLKSFDIDDKKLEKKKKSEAKQLLPVIMQLIEDDFPIPYYTSGKMSFLKSRIIYPLFCKFMMGDKGFFADGKCTSCGECVKSCPLKNIELVDGTPKWNKNCAQCLACIHHCPEKSIQYRKATQKKGRYTF